MSTVCSSLTGLFLFLFLSLPAFAADAPSPTWHLNPPKKAPSGRQPPFRLYEPAEKPFWQTKDSARRRIEAGEILVSVTSDEREAGQQELQQLFLKAAGQVAVPWEFARQKIKEFERLKRLSPEHFVEVKYLPSEEELYLHGVAMKYHARMTLRLFEEIREEEQKSRLHFRVIKGSFRGMTGFIELKEMGASQQKPSPTKTLFSMTAFYESEKLPLPSFLLSFGLEAVMDVVAKKMRRYLEAELKTQTNGTRNQEQPHDGKTSFSPNPTGDGQPLFSRTFSCLGDRLEAAR